MVPRVCALFNLKQKGRSELRPSELGAEVQESGYASTANGAHDEGQHQQGQEDEEEELCNTSRSAGNTAKTKECGDNCQDEECESPTEHVNLHFHA
jgi:hypothetical protein